MKKKIPIAGRIAGIMLVLGILPWFTNWVATDGMKAKFRAHYLAGTGRIVGVLGADELRDKLIYKADLIHFNYGEIKHRYRDKEEMLALITFVGQTGKGYSQYHYPGYDHGRLEIRLEYGQEDEYEERLIEWLDSFNKARKVTPVLSVEEFVRLDDCMGFNDAQQFGEAWSELQTRLCFTLKYMGTDYYSTRDRCMMIAVLEGHYLFSPEYAGDKHLTQLEKVIKSLVVQELLDSYYMSTTHPELTINSWKEEIKKAHQPIPDPLRVESFMTIQPSTPLSKLAPSQRWLCYDVLLK